MLSATVTVCGAVNSFSACLCICLVIVTHTARGLDCCFEKTCGKGKLIAGTSR